MAKEPHNNYTPTDNMVRNINDTMNKGKTAKPVKSAKKPANKTSNPETKSATELAIEAMSKAVEEIVKSSVEKAVSREMAKFIQTRNDQKIRHHHAQRQTPRIESPNATRVSKVVKKGKTNLRASHGKHSASTPLQALASNRPELPSSDSETSSVTAPHPPQATREVEAEDMTDTSDDSDKYIAANSDLESEDIASHSDSKSDNLAAGRSRGATADTEEAEAEEAAEYHKYSIKSWICDQAVDAMRATWRKDMARLVNMDETKMFDIQRAFAMTRVSIVLFHNITDFRHHMSESEERDHAILEEYEDAWARGESPRNAENFTNICQRYMDRLQQQQEIVQERLKVCNLWLGALVPDVSWEGPPNEPVCGLYYAREYELELVSSVDRLNFFAENDP